MSRTLAFVCVITLAAVLPAGAAAQGPPPNPRVVIETARGDITCELFRAQAPVSVANFLTYVQDGFYDGTIFHRVVRNFMIQGGGRTEDLTRKTDGLRGGILNEATNKLRNRRGTLAMARTAAPNSARSQFFINIAGNSSLDHRDTTPQGYGYAVFGKVIDGMYIVDGIQSVRTRRVNDMDNVPLQPIVIKRVRRLEP